MKSQSKTFILDPRLENDTLLISSHASLQIRLMNDQRWPWIIVVPEQLEVEDMDDLDIEALQALTKCLSDISAALKRMNICSSTNVATLGNMVKQMHWHVVGRTQGDANWPGPVWGFEKAVPYSKEEVAGFMANFKKEFRV